MYIIGWIVFSIDTDYNPSIFRGTYIWKISFYRFIQSSYHFSITLFGFTSYSFRNISLSL